jgi:hypothetical protein
MIAIGAAQGVVMAKFMLFAVSGLLLAALQAGCAGDPARRVMARSTPEPIHPTCDTSVGYVQLVGKVRNRGHDNIAFQLDDYGGPPFDPSYMSYRVYASAPGEPYELVHDSGHDSQWDRTVTIAPGDSMLFNVPIFGLRPADYYHYFRIEYRDARNRSYWTREFDLCAVTTNCACAGRGATSAAEGATRPDCPSAQHASAVLVESPREISLVCR